VGYRDLTALATKFSCQRTSSARSQALPNDAFEPTPDRSAAFGARPHRGAAQRWFRSHAPRHLRSITFPRKRRRGRKACDVSFVEGYGLVVVVPSVSVVAESGRLAAVSVGVAGLTVIA